MPRILIVEDDIGHSEHRPHIFPYPSPPLTPRRRTRRRAQPSGIGFAVVGTACLPEDAIRRADYAGGTVWREWEPEY
jgi:hypothetical protein